MSNQIRNLNESFSSEESQLFMLLSRRDDVEQLAFPPSPSTLNNHISVAEQNYSSDTISTAKAHLADRNSVDPKVFKEDRRRGNRSYYGSELSWQLLANHPIRFAGVSAMLQSGILPLMAMSTDKYDTNKPTETISASLSQVAAAFGPAQTEATADKDECPTLQQRYNDNTRYLLNDSTIQSLLKTGENKQHSGTLFHLVSRAVETADAFGKTLLAMIALTRLGVDNEYDWYRDKTKWCEDVQTLSKLVLDATNVIAERLDWRFKDNIYSIPPPRHDISSDPEFKNASPDLQKDYLSSRSTGWITEALQGSSKRAGENQPGLLPDHNLIPNLLKSYPKTSEGFIPFLQNCRDLALRTQKMTEVNTMYNARQRQLQGSAGDTQPHSSVDETEYPVTSSHGGIVGKLRHIRGKLEHWNRKDS